MLASRKRSVWVIVIVIICIAALMPIMRFVIPQIKGGYGGSQLPYPASLPNDLKKLIDADNGLFKDPNSSDLGSVESITSVYVNNIFLVAGHQNLKTTQTKIESHVSSTIENKLYAQWSTAQILGIYDHSNTDFTDFYMQRPSNTLNNEIGYINVLLEAFCSPQKQCQNISESNQILSLINSSEAKTLGLSNPYVESLRQKINSQLTGKNNNTDISLVLEKNDYEAPTELKTEDDFFITNGLAWLYKNEKYKLDATSLKKTIEPYLKISPVGHEMEASLAAQSWIWLGGGKERLSYYCDELVKRIDKQTGLIHLYKKVSGTVYTTYMVSRVTQNDFKNITTDKTITSLSETLNTPTVTDETLPIMLEAACALKTINSKNSNAQSDKLINLANENIKNQIFNKDNLENLQILLDTIQCLGGTPSPVKITPFAIESDTDNQPLYMLIGWLKLGYVSNADELQNYYSKYINSLDSTENWTDGDGELVSPYIYRFAALNINNSLNGDTADLANRFINRATGCSASPYLIEAAFNNKNSCSLENTLQLMSAGIIFDNKTNKWAVMQ